MALVLSGHGLSTFHAEGLFLRAHGGDGLQCDLRVLDLLRLSRTWVLKEVDQGGSPR